MAIYQTKLDQEKSGDNLSDAFQPEKAKKEEQPEPKREVEKIPETKESLIERKETASPVTGEKETAAAPVVLPQKITTAIFKSPTRKEIESILEEDLAAVYQQMDPLQKKKFKQEGEVAASKIEQLMSAVKVKAKEILGVIRAWLKLIPGVNKFFLEQEVKIKADKILRIKQKEK